MADKIAVGAGPGATAKTRHPVAVPALTIITLGIYGIYWWYQINRELVALVRARGVDGLGDSPTKSHLPVFPGFLIQQPAYTSLYNTAKRLRRPQQVTSNQVT